MQNYFEFFDLPMRFHLDEQLLKERFYSNSKKFHPDFHAMKSEEEQNYFLEQSTINNKAFWCLRDFHSRLEYILQLSGTMQAEEKYQLSSSFLMQMMDLNEAIAELSFEPDPAKQQGIKQEINQINEQIENDIQELSQQADQAGLAHSTEVLQQLKDLYYQRKYLGRLKGN